MDGQSYRKLDACQKAMEAPDAVYVLSRNFPAEERYGLTAQVRRAALSVPSNIAEGHGRHRIDEYLHHLYMVRGSLKEAETQHIAAARQEMCSRDAARPAWDELQQTGRLLNHLIASLDNTNHNAAS